MSELHCRTVTVDDNILRSAKRGSYGHCILKKAIDAAFPEITEVKVDRGFVEYKGKDGKVREKELPVLAETARFLWDGGAKGETFSFQLALVVK